MKSYLSDHKTDYSFCMCVAGKQHTGKTTFVEQNIVIPFIKKNNSLENIFIFDIQGDWRNYYKQPLTDFVTFSKMVSNKTNSLIIFEEASIFFKHNSSNDIITKMLVDLYHKGNIIILNFHSLRKIPLYIADLTTYFTIFKTDDTADFVEKKFLNPKLTQAVIQVAENTDNHYHLTITK